MSRKLRLDSLKADLSSVTDLLNDAVAISDPIGKLQYGHRKNMLETEIAKLESETQNMASVALFFGGKPVFGSRGISADFAGFALNKFQSIISEVYTKRKTGELGARGSVPQDASSQLMITELAKGSFGFILDELNDQASYSDSNLKSVLGEVVNILENVGASNEQLFEKTIENIDARILGSLKDFFANLDKNQATLRVVEDTREYTMDQTAIYRARNRTESVSIKEEPKIISGLIVGFMPKQRRFELERNGEEIHGAVAKEALKSYKASDIVDKNWKVKLEVRAIKTLNKKERKLYNLLEFIEEV